MLGPEVIQVSKCLARVVTDFWVVTLLLELINHDDRNHNFLLFELEQGTWVRQQHRCVEHVCLGGDIRFRLRSLCGLGFLGGRS